MCIRVLQEFAEQNDGNKIEVVYVVSGWSKSDPRTYSVQLVPKAKLQGDSANPAVAIFLGSSFVELLLTKVSWHLEGGT